MNLIFHNLAGRLMNTVNRLACGVMAFTLLASILTNGSPIAHAQMLPLPEILFEASKNTPDTLPNAGNREAPRVMKIPVTAYNSLPNQTDSTPFHTADGTHVRDGIIAANFLPLGTRVKFPELYGDKEFVVKDRMNARYHYKADIWMENYTDAVQFGLNYTTIEIY